MNAFLTKKHFSAIIIMESLTAGAGGLQIARFMKLNKPQIITSVES
jgi:hypothetical protein